MKISVVLCTYNSGKFIQEQLESILNQSYKIDEIIIQDDCSNDETLSIISDINKKYNKNIIIEVNTINKGYIKNFDYALQRCQGDIIFFSDHDDFWHVNKVFEIMQYFKKNKDALMVFSDGLLMNEFSEISEETLWNKFSFNEIERLKFDKAPFLYLQRNDVVTGATVAIRRSLIKHILPFPSNYIHDTWMALIASSVDGLFYINKKLINYRIHMGQQIGLNENKPNFLGNNYEKVLDKIDILLDRLDDTNSYKWILYEKRKFYSDRDNYSPNFILKFYQILKNRKLYKLYAHGYFSIIKDYIWRGR